MKIAIDAMGGDFAPMETVLGSIEAVRANQHIEVVLVGDEQQIFDILEANNEAKNPRISVHHASQVIGMDEHPGQALRKKKDASVVVATSLVRDNRCDAVIAPGSTGAAVAAALFGLGRIKGIDRPVIATPMPLDFAADGAFVAVKLFGDFGDGAVAEQVLDVVSFVLGQLCVAHGNLSCRKGRMLPHTGLFLLGKVALQIRIRPIIIKLHDNQKDNIKKNM